MLKRLTILNSEIYAKADIVIDDIRSMQIVGPNNIGKSTLIYALNFLFIIDGREMSFSGNRTGDKTTINHYFPTINSSYIIFEIFKNRFYCILVKRNTDGKLDYYKIDSDYKEEYFFEQTAHGQKIRPFEELLTGFSMQGIEYQSFSNRRDVFNFVYQKGKRNNAVVWLDQNVVQDARSYSNNFSKIYKYLINSRLINNQSLKDALVIADNKENEKVSFSRKNKKDIVSPIREMDPIMAIFDGKIKLPDDLEGKPVESLEKLKEEIGKHERERSNLKNLLDVAHNLEKHQANLRDINQQIRKIEEKREQISQIPVIEKDLKNLQIEFSVAEDDQKDTKIKIEQFQQRIDDINVNLENIQYTIGEKESRLKQIQDWKVEIEEWGIQPTESQTEETIDNLFQYIRKNRESQREIKYRKNNLFENLKAKTETSYADEKDFIAFIDSELVSLEDKQSAIDGLLKSISTQFSNPCRAVYSRFEEFKAFIVNRFNSQIGKIQISDIESLKVEIIDNDRLIRDLKKIQEIRDLKSGLLFDDQQENLNILNKYLDNETTVLFDDLFDIRLHLNKENQHKVVDLKQQIESDGTDKMIRLVLIMSIINQIIINDEENKVVIFVDEIGTIDEANRIELLKFCEEYNFIPISAAPLHPYDGFDKYYIIRRGPGKIVVSESNGNVIRRKQPVVT